MMGPLFERSSSRRIRDDWAAANSPDEISSSLQRGCRNHAGENPFSLTRNNRMATKSGIDIEAPITIDTMPSSKMRYSTFLDIRREYPPGNGVWHTTRPARRLQTLQDFVVKCRERRNHETKPTRFLQIEGRTRSAFVANGNQIACDVLSRSLIRVMSKG
jgi:hypothetical protein